MGRMTVPLSDLAIKKAKPQEKIYKISDGNNLYLVVRPNGTKFFRYDYKFNDKRQSISLGTYPQTSLKEARDKAVETKGLIKNGIDPLNSREKKNTTSDTTFEAISLKWLNMMQIEWSKSTHTKTSTRLSQYAFPFIGNKEIAQVSRIDILGIIEKLQSKELFETAIRTMNALDRIFKYAVTYGFVEHNIIADIDKKVVMKRKDVEHMPALTKEKDIKELLKDISEFESNFKADICTIYALKLAPYVFLRPFNLRTLEWSEIDFKNELLDISAQKMKMREDFILPLSAQAIKILNEIKPYSFHKSQYVFPSSVSNLKTLSENTLNHALAKMGYKDTMTSHGFRSMFSTIAHEKAIEHGFNSDIIESCLAHAEQNKVKAAYNRTNKMKYFKEKQQLVQWWADWLDA